MLVIGERRGACALRGCKLERWWRMNDLRCGVRGEECFLSLIGGGTSMTRKRSYEGGGSGGRKEQKMALLFFTVAKFIPSAGWRSLVWLQTRERLLIKSSSLSTCGQRSSSNARSSKMNMEPERLFLQALCWMELESEKQNRKVLHRPVSLFLFLAYDEKRHSATSTQG